MSRVCKITGKKVMSGNNRSHSLRATRRKWNVNLQNATINIKGKPHNRKTAKPQNRKTIKP